MTVMVLPGFVAECVAEVMADYDRQLASEPDFIMRCLMRRDRAKFEAKVRAKTVECLGKAAFDTMGDDGTRQ
jgi:hypothetical protein